MKIALKKSQKKIKRYIDKKEDSIVQSGRQSIIKYKEFGMVDEKQKDKEVYRKICETILENTVELELPILMKIHSGKYKQDSIVSGEDKGIEEDSIFSSRDGQRKEV